MEFISTSQLQKYESIIDKIKCEFEKYELLKKDLDKENDNLIISQLAESTGTRKLSHLNIQVFNRFTELLNLYGDELQNEQFNKWHKSDAKFYLIEMYITKSLMQKARGLKCMLHITLKTKNVNINKTVTVKNKIPLREVIVVDNDIINSTVEASLLVPSELKWIIIRLNTVYVDISYHFQIYKERLIPEYKVKNIIQITKSYNNGIINQDQQELLILESKLFCDLENDSFISTVLKNCYQSVDLDVFFELNNTDKEFVLKLSDGTEPFTLKFNRRQKYLKLEGNIYKLCLLKKYFSKEFCCGGSELPKNFSSDVLDIVKANENIPQIPQEICAFFCEVRSCWSKLPI